jgi:hypothetical protein
VTWFLKEHISIQGVWIYALEPFGGVLNGDLVEVIVRIHDRLFLCVESRAKRVLAQAGFE